VNNISLEEIKELLMIDAENFKNNVKKFRRRAMIKRNGMFLGFE